MRAHLLLIAAILLCLAPIGCGGGGGGNPPPGNVRVVVSPNPAAMTAGQSMTFAGTVTGTGTTTVSWRVQEGAAGGTITQSGVYTPPSPASQTAQYHVTATSQADANQSDTATVTVNPNAGDGNIGIQ